MANGKNRKLHLTKSDEGKLRPKPVKEDVTNQAKPAAKPKPSPSSAVKNIEKTAIAYAKFGKGKQTQELGHELDAAPKPKPGSRHKHKHRHVPTPTPPGIHKEK